MTYELIQSALTAATEIIAIAGMGGIIAHAFHSHHKSRAPQTTPTPEVKPEVAIQSPQPEVVQEETETTEELFQQVDEIMTKPIYAETILDELKQLNKELGTASDDWEPNPEYPEAEEVTQTIPTAKALEEVVKPRKTRSKGKPQPMSVGAAAIDYTTMTSEQLRKECGRRGVNWRTGGIYNKPMKKIEMLAALR